MKTFITIILLATVLIGKSAQVADAPQTASAPLELVLNCKVSFDAATNVSMELVYRNIGVTNYLNAEALEASQRIIWDGKEYNKRDLTIWAGSSKLYPLQGMTVGFHLLDYPIPSKVLNVGRHTIAVRVDLSKSNTLTSDTLTVFIGKQYRPIAR